ncbi:unnamed protein product [Bemisia tabaci]|uniref:Ionotropic glutamate receptor C-terminal domain-containing protein n=1 Tax=Bemisia tabaci TaxID=7038 RepID=A0A9P0F034_BEMTA|nr:unnamed protein product [Bemisia tabaci]
MNLSVLLCVLTVWGGGKNKVFGLHHGKETELKFLPALNVCKIMVDLSKRKLFYVLSLNIDFPIHSFIRSLHETGISTIHITQHHWLKHSVIGYQPKNFIFLLNDLDEILSLILDSVSQSAPNFDGIHQNQITNNISSFGKLNRYCVRGVEGNTKMIDTNATCDFEWQTSSSELAGDSVPSDPTLELTAGLTPNNVWNSLNYIVFMLPKGAGKTDSMTIDQGNIDERNLVFSFKFFWRFFRGLRTVICIEYRCFNYDPFLDLILQTDTTDGNNSTPILPRHSYGRKFTIGFVHKTEMSLDSDKLITGLSNVIYEVVDTLKIEVDYEVIEIGRHFEAENIGDDEYKMYLMYNIDLLIFRDGISTGETDFTKFDFSAAVQSCSHCFATPRSNFVPQYLLPFKCFSVSVWLATTVGVLALYFVFYAFHYSQWTLFRQLYSEEVQRAFQNTSVFFILYSYFLVGCPSRLLLGTFVTGKIIFTITSFFVLIIVTLYQSKMTELLSMFVRYPDIDSLEDLSNSNLLIQTRDLNQSMGLLQDYAALRNKLSESYKFYFVWSEHFENNWEQYGNNLTVGSQLSNDQDERTDSFLREAKEIKSNMQSIMASDAIEVAVSSLRQDFQGNFLLRGEYTAGSTEFHLVKECLMTYLLTLRFLKTSTIWMNLFLKRVNALVESGIVGCLMNAPAVRGVKIENDISTVTLEVQENSEAKPLMMQNLQPAFLGLVTGWTVSFVVFAIELAVDVCRNTSSKFMRWAEKWIRPPSLWA